MLDKPATNRLTRAKSERGGLNDPVIIALIGSSIVLLVGGLLYRANQDRIKQLILGDARGTASRRLPRPATHPTPERVPAAATPQMVGAGAGSYPSKASVVGGGSVVPLTGVVEKAPGPYDRTTARFPWDSTSLPLPDAQPEAGTVAQPTSGWPAIARETVETAILTLLIFVVMRSLIQNYRIEGYSMEPNLHEQQYLIVNKVAYYLGEPKRGDIIVFEYPKGDPNGPERDYIKRIIGLPGDTVECRPNEIVVNGHVINEPYGPNPWTYSCPPTTLGPDEYYVLGDNRPASSDSHQWGTLERKYIIGKAWISYWPRENWGRVPNYPIEAPSPQPAVAQTP